VSSPLLTISAVLLLLGGRGHATGVAATRAHTGDAHGDVRGVTIASPEPVAMESFAAPATLPVSVAAQTALPAGGDTATTNSQAVLTDDDRPYRHPLLQEGNRAVVDEYFRVRRGAARDFLRDHVVRAGLAVAAEGADATRVQELTPVHREAVPGHVPSQEPPAPTLSLGSTVQRWIENPASRPSGDVRLSLAILPGWNPTTTVSHAQRVAMLEGRLRTRADAGRVRTETVRAKTQAGTAALQPLRRAVESLGGRVTALVPNAGTMKVVFPISQLDALLQHKGLGRLELTADLTDDAGIAYDVDGTRIDGRELEDLLQTTQFYDRGYLGDPNERIAVVEGGAPDVFNDHPGLDGRYTNCGDDGAGACDWARPVTGTAHATATASVLLGDITQGQDATITGDLAQRKRSGVARQAWGRGLSAGDFQFLSDRLTAYNDTHILTQSASFNDDPECRGETTSSRNWNSLYEDGYALFNSAGNNGHSDPNDCTVASPATAIGVFAVGAYVIDGNDNEAIYSQSDQGGDGTVPEGRNRTIIDIVGPSGLEYAYPHYAWPVDASGVAFRYGTEWSSGPGPSSFCCTSSSTPAVAGSAALFRQWFKDVHGSAIDDPGLLYVNLLLMGDRQMEGGFPGLSRKNVGFDGLWGAGKLRLRLFDSLGLDGPSTWSSGSVCVDDGTNVYIDMGYISDDVEIINTVVSWYDRRHDDGTHHDNVDLEVQRDSGGGSWVAVRTSQTTDDKERVAIETPQSGVYRMKIRGYRVTADDEGCGTNSNLVYFAYIAEDNDREPAENLDAVRPYPLNPTFGWNGEMELMEGELP
jgi:hypothetical protein